MQSCIIVCRSTVNHALHAGSPCAHPKLSFAPSVALETSRPSPGIYPGGSGSESLRHILFESKLEISACLGTASACPVWGFSQSGCSLPSLRSTQPCRRRWRTTSHASSKHYKFLFRVRRHGSKGIFASLLQNERDCLSKISQALFVSLALTVRSRHLSTVGYEPPAILFDDRCELVPHRSYL
jgi:hypothetical protein